MTCAYAGDSFECGSCPPGFLEYYGDTYEVWCEPQLLGLTVVGGVLDAPFEPGLNVYTATASSTSTAAVARPGAWSSP